MMECLEGWKGYCGKLRGIERDRWEVGRNGKGYLRRDGRGTFAVW